MECTVKEDMGQLYGHMQKYKMIPIGTDLTPAYERIQVKEEIDYHDKTVLDIGATLESIVFFIQQGARRVYGVNRDDDEMQRMENACVSNVFFLKKDIQSPRDIYQIIFDCPSDIVKIDIEGAENNIIRTEAKELTDILRRPGLFIIELHPILHLDIETVYKLWLTWCDINGFRIIGRREYRQINPDEVCKDLFKNFEEVKLIIMYMEAAK